MEVVKSRLPLADPQGFLSLTGHRLRKAIHDDGEEDNRQSGDGPVGSGSV